MSVRVKAKLVDQLSSQVEGSFLRTQNVVRLEGIRAEMVVDVSRAFMEHEAPKHDYLPCFHMMGTIKEIRGKFPYDVSAVYFDQKDELSLMQDIHYYPTPDELAHIIKVGHFYSPDFVIPPILAKNTYSLPCMIDLTVIPPRDEVGYQTMLVKGFDDLEDEDKTNFPVFYVGILGTGVSRKNDKLLDYYGIDLEDGFTQFVLTAESSGYTDPPLLQYMEEPLVAQRGEKEDMSEYYITPEEEAELLRLGREQQASQERTIEDLSQQQNAEYEATPEDAIVSQADRRVMRRMEQQMGSKKLSLEAVRNASKSKTLQTQDENEQQTEKQDVKGSEKKGSEGEKQDNTTRKEETRRNDEKKNVTEPTIDEKSSTTKVSYDPAKKKEEDEKRAEKKARDVAVARESVETRVSAKEKKANMYNQKQDMQEVKEVEMDLNTERNEYVEKQREEEKSKNNGAQQDGTNDIYILEKANASDVSDAREQEKLNEAQRRQNTRNVATSVQQVIGEYEKAQKSHREVPAEMEEITEQYEEEHESAEPDVKTGDMGE